MNITEKEKILFNELRIECSGIVEDGIVDEQQYLSAKYKIVYVMKEVNGGKGWNLKDFLYEGGCSRTWDNIARWTEGIFNLEQDYSWKHLQNNNEKRRKKFLKKIGSINLKKTSGKHTSVPKEIFSEAVKNSNIIKKQIDEYDPDIIICYGTASAFVNSYFDSKEIFWKMTKRGVEYIKYNDKIIVSFAHPEARIRNAYLHYVLIDAMREILE